MDALLVEVLRGDRVESQHGGRAVIVDAEGGVLFAAGDVEAPVFTRSTIKALLALPLVEGGAADRLGLDEAELALACASHGGEPTHAATAAAMLAKAGQEPGCLECGAHWPTSRQAAFGLAAAGGVPSVLHNNCSGKHAGFVCAAVDAHQPIAGYVRAEHPVMRQALDAVAASTGARLGEENAGIDGCGIPTHAIPLRALALGFARFGSGAGLAPDRARAAARLRRAVARHPEMVAGTGRFDTLVMQQFGEAVFTKMGAEGVHVAALPALGLGLAVKCDDGAGRAAEVAMAALLARTLPEGGAELEPFVRPVLRNWGGTEVGGLRPAGALSDREARAPQ